MATLQDLYNEVAILLGQANPGNGSASGIVGPTQADELSLAITNTKDITLQYILALQSWQFYQKVTYLSQVIGATFNTPDNYSFWVLPSDFGEFIAFANNQGIDVDYFITELPRTDAGGAGALAKLILVKNAGFYGLIQIDPTTGGPAANSPLGIIYRPTGTDVSILPFIIFQLLAATIAEKLQAAFAVNSPGAGEITLAQRVQRLYQQAIKENNEVDNKKKSYITRQWITDIVGW